MFTQRFNNVQSTINAKNPTGLIHCGMGNAARHLKTIPNVGIWIACGFSNASRSVEKRQDEFAGLWITLCRFESDRKQRYLSLGEHIFDEQTLFVNLCLYESLGMRRIIDNQSDLFICRTNPSHPPHVFNYVETIFNYS